MVPSFQAHQQPFPRKNLAVDPYLEISGNLVVSLSINHYTQNQLTSWPIFGIVYEIQDFLSRISNLLVGSTYKHLA
jgi:hypothetical protein